MRRALLLLITFCVIGCGGDRYEIVAVSAGEFRTIAAYRLDKKTGEMVLLVDANGIPVKIKKRPN